MDYFQRYDKSVTEGPKCKDIHVLDIICFERLRNHEVSSSTQHNFELRKRNVHTEIARTNVHVKYCGMAIN